MPNPDGTETDYEAHEATKRIRRIAKLAWNGRLKTEGKLYPTLKGITY